MAFRYPIALDLVGRRCVVLGGDAKAEQRVEALLDGEADVVVVAAEFSEGLERLGAGGRVELVRRDYAPGDLAGAVLGLAVTEDPELRAAAFSEAERSGVLLNALDDPSHCHFAVPAILRRGDLTVAISTAGKAPALAKRLRQDLGELLGEELGALVEALSDVRTAAMAERRVDFDTWARRWQVALGEGLADLVVEGRMEEAKATVRAALDGAPASSEGGRPLLGPDRRAQPSPEV
ncbi:MAG: precorrin-2 dehydrogenase/sirohydrochlorin ferrochelatase family protein [Acidimicrobiia bacterium]